jgi:hypothetical protein
LGLEVVEKAFDGRHHGGFHGTERHRGEGSRQGKRLRLDLGHFLLCHQVPSLPHCEYVPLKP